MAASGITIESVQQAYLENADYDVDCDVAKAKAFVVAIRRMISFAQSSSNQSSSMSFDLAALQNERQIAEAFINANDTSNRSGEFACYGFSGYERGAYDDRGGR